jgi:putative ABC transport system permease protein
MLWRVRAFLQTVFRSKELDSDLDAELAAAVEELTRNYQRDGLDPAAAGRQARLDMGGVQQAKERTRDVRPGISLELVWCDVRHALRSLRQSPTFTLSVVLTFAIGIGANTAIFTAVKQLLLEPLPYPHADRLVFIWSDLRAAGYPRAPLAGPELQDLRVQTRSFESLGAIWANTAALTGDQDPEQLRVGLVTANFFDVLGVEPALGRVFIEADAEPGGLVKIVLSSDLWRRRFGSDPSIVGRAIQVNGAAAEVVGVLPDAFKLWMPPDAAVPPDLQAFRPFVRTIVNGSRRQQYLRVVGRLREGITASMANDDVASVGQRVGREFPEYASAAPAFSAIPLHEDVTREVRTPLLALLSGVALLMVLACFNVANLLVARAASQEGVIALRSALGASEARLFQHALIECLWLAAAGASAGLALSAFLLEGLHAIRPEALGRFTGRLDVATILFATGLAISCALVSAVMPTMIVRRVARRAALGGVRGTVSGQLEYRVRAALVGLQIALSLVLLVSAGLLARSLFALQNADLGFSARNAVTFRIAPPPARYAPPVAMNAFSENLQAQLGGIEGVQAVGAISHLPFDNLPNWSTPYRSAEAGNESPARDADARTITPGYLSAIGATLLEGRDFTLDDSAGKERVAIVDQRLAQQLWQDGAAVGRRIRTDPGTTGNPQTLVTIVGVIKHMRHRTVSAEVREQIYFPQRQVFRAPMSYVMTADDPAMLPQAIRSTLARLDPALPVFEMRPLGDYLDRALSVSRFTAILASVYSVIALLLAVIGVYGVLAFATSRRQPELAVRMAVGASRWTIAKLVLGEAAAIVAAGVVLGIGAALVTSRSLRAQLYGVGAHDLYTYAVCTAVIASVAALAALLPTLRAMRASILRTLRSN